MMGKNTAYLRKARVSEQVEITEVYYHAAYLLGTKTGTVNQARESGIMERKT